MCYMQFLFIKGERNSKASVKIGSICPSHISMHKNNNKIAVEYQSTHLWHTNEIGKLTLNKDDRSKLAGM